MLCVYAEHTEPPKTRREAQHQLKRCAKPQSGTVSRAQCTQWHETLQTTYNLHSPKKPQTQLLHPTKELSQYSTACPKATQLTHQKTSRHSLTREKASHVRINDTKQHIPKRTLKHTNVITTIDIHILYSIVYSPVSVVLTYCLVWNSQCPIVVVKVVVVVVVFNTVRYLCVCICVCITWLYVSQIVYPVPGTYKRAFLIKHVVVLWCGFCQCIRSCSFRVPPFILSLPLSFSMLFGFNDDSVTILYVAAAKRLINIRPNVDACVCVIVVIVVVVICLWLLSRLPIECVHARECTRKIHNLTLNILHEFVAVQFPQTWTQHETTCALRNMIKWNAEN